MNILIPLILVSFLIYGYLKLNTAKIYEYYVDALTLYIFKGHEDAKIAVITAAKISDNKQRALLIDYTIKLEEDLKKIGNDELRNLLVNRVHDISQAVTQKPDWTFDDKAAAKAELGKVNEDYLKAVEKVDSKIFRNKYPYVFETPMKEFRLSIFTGAVKRILDTSDQDVGEDGGGEGDQPQ